MLALSDSFCVILRSILYFQVSGSLRILLLRHREQRVKIALLLHQRIKAPEFRDFAVFQHKNSVIAAQQCFLQTQCG